MTSVRTHTRLAWAALVAAWAASWPSLAHAELFSFTMAGKGDTFHGSGDLFQRFESRFGGGAELGIEALYVDFFGEAVILGTQQYLFTANIGFDFSVGDEFRLTFGAFTGPMFFLFPKDEQEPIKVDCALLPEEYAMPQQCAELQNGLNDYQAKQENLSRLVIGWNLVRPRIDLDIKLAPGVYFGVAAQAGYHYLLSGEDVASGAKNEALNQFARDNDIPDDELGPIREAIGAKPIDMTKLNGFNYEIQAHLKVELGT